MTKYEASEKVSLALREVLNGEIYLNPRFMSRVMGRMMTGKETVVQPMDRLTDRELEVFHLIGQGRTTNEIAMTLNLGSDIPVISTAFGASVPRAVMICPP